MDPNGDGRIELEPYSIGGAKRGTTVRTIGQSDTILLGGDTAFKALDGNGRGFDSGLKQNQVGNLAAQTLTLAYNNREVAGFGAQSLAAIGCGSANATNGLGAYNPGGLTDGSTMLEVLGRANFLLDEGVSGPPVVSVQQLTALTSLLGRCVNQE